MKKIFTSLLLMITANTYAQETITGSTYEDAVKFLNYIKNGREEAALSIVAYYSDHSQYNQALNIKNPFLDKYLKEVEKHKALSVSPKAFREGVASNIMGLDVTKYADATAQFLIERGREELSMAFFDRFRKDLGKYPEIAALFPHTTDIVRNIESFNIQTLLQQLRDAFIKDLSNMPTNILSLRDIDIAACGSDNACTQRLKDIRDLFNSDNARLLVIPLNLMQGIIDGNNITELLNKVVADPLICGNDDDLNSYIKLTAMLFESLKTNDNDGGLFISQSQLKNLFFSEDLLNVFLGLVYQKYSNSATAACYSSLAISGKSLSDIFRQIIIKRNQFYSAITSFDKINIAYCAIKKQIANGAKIDMSYYASIISGSISMTDNFISGTSIILGYKLPAAYRQLSANMNIASDLCIDVQQKNYSGLFNDIIKFIDLNKIISSEDNANKKLVKYLSFASNMATAADAEQIKEALNTVALPPGSYSIKQKSGCNISLNGYLGYAWDIIDDKKKHTYAHGICAPVGFTLSKGLGKRNGGAVSIFVGLADIGAVASYRLENSPSDTLVQQIKLESIIAPSAQLLFEIPKTPIALCAGWRMTPKLFYQKNNDFLSVAPRSVFNFSILIDIPIATIYNKPYK